MSKVVPMHGFGGGGVLLNFDVVCGPTEPTNPKENMFWVNSDTPMSSWEFSTVLPTGETGKVWFKTSLVSSTPFNALKKNNLQVYPSAVMQYVDGAWSEKTAKVYQGGKWVGFELYLYNLGALGKVWNNRACKISGESGAKANAPTVSSGSDGVLQIRQGVAAACGIAHYPDLVDLTNYNTLTFDGVIYSDKYGLAGLGIWTGFSTYIYEGRVAQILSGVNGVATLDVTALKGNYYIGFWLHDTPSSVDVRSLKLS